MAGQTPVAPLGDQLPVVGCRPATPRLDLGLFPQLMMELVAVAMLHNLVRDVNAALEGEVGI